MGIKKQIVKTFQEDFMSYKKTWWKKWWAVLDNTKNFMQEI